MSTPHDVNGFDLDAAPDVSSIEDQGIEVHILNQSGDPLYYQPSEGGDSQPVTITMAGSYSSRYRKAINAQTTRMLNKRTQKMTGELAQENRLMLVARCALKWSGFHKGGQPLVCSPENVREVLEKAPWIRDQLEVAMEDHEAFSRNSLED